MADDVSLNGYQPGGLASLAALQCEYYGAEYGLGAKFESIVSADVADFLARFDPDRDFVHLVQYQAETRGASSLTVRMANWRGCVGSSCTTFCEAAAWAIGSFRMRWISCGPNNFQRFF